MQFIVTVLSGFLVIAVLVIWQVTDQLWLGVRFEAPPVGEQGGLIVAKVDKNGPAAGKLAVDQRLLAISDENQSIVLLERLLEAPDVFPTYAGFNAFLQEQQQAAEILSSKTVTFLLADGSTVVVNPEPRHSPASIPGLYLLYILCGFFCCGMGLLLWYYRAGLFVSYLVLVAGIGTLIYYLSVVLQYRELALPLAWMKATAATSIVGTNLFAWGYLSIFAVYPLRVASNRVVWGILGVMTLLTFNNLEQWVDLPLHTYMLQFLFVGIGIYWLLVLQWRVTRKHPVEHATVRLFIMTMAVPSVLIILVWLVPILLGKQAWLSHEFARLIFVPIATGWAIAVFRYHLFNVEWWWYVSVMWLVGVTVILVPYAILVYLFDFEPLLALSLTLLSAVFLYFPVERKVILRVRHDLPSSADAAVSTLVKCLGKASTDKDIQEIWHKTLEYNFRPISIRHGSEWQKHVFFKDEGVCLCVPDVVGEGCYELEGKQQGDWLFNERDVQVAQSLFELTHAILKATHAREEATLAERTRIMRDLHDSLGAKLLSMAQRCRGVESEDHAREALQTLRDTVHLSTTAEQLDLAALLGEWRVETRERVEIADAKLHWKVDGVGEGLYLSSARVLLLRSFLRETVSNALKHVRSENLYVRFAREDNVLYLCVGNDSVSADPTSWKLGFGLSHLRDRLVRAGGELKIIQRQVAGGGTVDEIWAKIPL
ncbi:sensor histidine kinase [Thiothrix nivea]|uniref:sensor histidine kinase n=1 Tax=Thiothrix nivea TaxID=1031 RepID=UPI00145F9728|nr:histidine kinase [Thiothrix nivea]